MSLALELGIDESEVASWKISKFARWLAFFEYRNELEKDAAERAARRR